MLYCILGEKRLEIKTKLLNSYLKLTDLIFAFLHSEIEF